jgi:hypothetical protein
VGEITPECWELYLRCMAHEQKATNLCQDDCLKKYGDPNLSKYEQFKKCLKQCADIAQATQDLCAEELDKCAGRDPRERQRYEDHQKEVFSANANNVQSFGGITIGVGVTIAFAAAGTTGVPAGFAVAGLGVAAIGAGLFLTASYAIQKVTDPIDNNFESSARPRPPEPFFVKATPGTPIDADVAKAINAVLENQANAIGLDRALMSSVNRAQGAAVAKKRTYEKLQMKNARNYAGELATLLRESARLRSKAVTKLRDNGVVFSITEDQAYNMRDSVLEKGLPPKFKRILSRYCENASERKGVQLRFVSQLSDVHQFEATFPDVLSKPKLASAEKKIASTLEEFSQSTYISL